MLITGSYVSKSIPPTHRNGRKDSSCRDSHTKTGYPLSMSECSFTVMRGPLSGNQAPHRLALLLFGFTLQGGRTTYPASPQGNNQLGRNEFTINNAALMHNVHNTVTKYKCAKCAATRTHGSQQGRTQTNTCAGFSRVQTSVLPSFNKFQQVPAKLHVSCKPKYCTKYYGAAARPKSRGPKRYCARPIRQNYPKTQNKTIPGHSSCVPAVPKLHRRSSGSETTCRAVAARGFSSPLVRRSPVA